MKTVNEVSLNKNQIEILLHTKLRATDGLFCGGSKDMDDLVEQGLMEFKGKKAFVPDKYYALTIQGDKLSDYMAQEKKSLNK
jgi:hypothetical protein